MLGGIYGDTMEQTSRGIRAATLILFEVGAIATLHAIGGVAWFQIPWRRLGDWLQQTPADESLPALLRIVALVLTYWLTVSTALYALAGMARIPAAVRAIEWATLPVVRRVVDGTAALTIVAATVAGPTAPAIANDLPSPIVVEIGQDGLPIPPFADGEDAAPAGTVPQGAARIGWTPTPAGAPTPAAVAPPTMVTTEPARWTVAPGDNLWTIAERHLGGFAASEAELPDVGDYWHRVVVANQDLIRSSDPDLIYPGEIVVLPPVAVEQP